jgi:hypothetical protein
LVPLDSGTEWTYDRIDTLVIQGRQPQVGNSSLTMRVVGDTTFRGLRYAILENTESILGGEINNPVWYFADRADGFHSAGVLTFLAAPIPNGFPVDFLEFPYPARVGGYYSFGVVSVASIDTTIATPAGMFHCLAYVSVGNTTQFVAAGVGVVRQEVVNDAGTTKARTVYQLRETTAKR